MPSYALISLSSDPPHSKIPFSMEVPPEHTLFIFSADTLKTAWSISQFMHFMKALTPFQNLMPVTE